MKLTVLEERGLTLAVQLDGLDVSYVNGIRRVMLSDVPVVCLRTAPFDKSECVVSANTTSLSNDVVKQRIGCLPVCLFKNPDIMRHYGEYYVKLDVVNETPSPLYVTTMDMHVIHKITGDHLVTSDVFPPFHFKGTDHYVDLFLLQPKLTERKAERITLESMFSIGSGKECGKYNAVTACALTGVIDPVRRDEAKAKYAAAGGGARTAMDLSNWDAIEAPRYTVSGSHVLTFESAGAYENVAILRVALTVLTAKFVALAHSLQSDARPKDSMPNCFYVTLPACSYTEGNILAYEVFQTLMEGTGGVTYVAFERLHPHDPDGVLKVAFAAPDTDVVGTLARLIEDRILPQLEELLTLV